MSKAAHNAAMRAAEATGRDLRDLFARLGSVEHPNTGIRRAYEQARNGLAGNLTNAIVMQAVLGELRARLQEVARALTAEAEAAGLEQAARNLRVYDMEPVPVMPVAAAAARAWTQTTDAQLDGIQAMALTGDANEGLILGDAGHVGLLAPGLATREGAKWLAWAANTAAAQSRDATLERNGAKGDFLRQAFAAIDRRTTQTCILVHGQVVGIDEPFTLEGTPRYADQMMHSPFHDFCRTAIALVHRRDVADEVSERARAERDQGVEDYNRRQQEQAARAARGPRVVTTPRQPGEVTPKQAITSWESGSRNRRAVTMKQAARNEFGLPGVVYSPRDYAIAESEIAEMQRVVRQLYQDTQAELRRRGISSVTLYRGVKSEYRIPGVLESWTTDEAIAKRFDGYDVLREVIPARRVLAWHQGPHWTGQRFAYQAEWILLSESPG